MNQALAYICHIRQMTEEVLKTQMEHIEQAAQAAARTLQSGGRIFVFGSGHSHMLAEEMFYRAGGLAGIHPILQDTLMLHVSATGSTELERREGLGTQLFQQYGVRRGDMLVIASNAGRNAVPVELAAAGAENGVCVLAVTSLKHSRSVSSRHKSGKKLFELADIVFDNLGGIGDAAIAVGELRTAPTSTVVGAMMLNAMTARCVGILAEQGAPLEVFASSNMDGGDEANRRLIEKYKQEIPCL